jgi:hypothetical protein
LSLVANILQLAEIEPPVRITDSLRSRRWGYQTTRYREGDNFYVGVYRRSETPSFYAEETVVELPRKGHVYLAGGVLAAQEGKMQKPAYLGETDRVTVTLKGMGSVLLAVYPYRVEGVEVDLPSDAESGQLVEGTVRLKETGKPGIHIAHVEVRDPAGMRHPLYSKNIVLKDGRGAFQIPFAYNDARGDWTVTVREAVTSNEVKSTINLGK